ncbi:MAG: TonB-dependent receptor [Saprospiraceae bacterium]
MRGLSADQVLVLVNGKRRHNSALVNVNGTFGRGNVGTDMNALPAVGIERIEILRDGAAAQYGSDAIAGVINLIMKDDYNQLTAQLTTGSYFSEGANSFTGGNDGASYDLSLNYGLPLGNRGGFVNFTGSFESRDFANRMKEYTGSIYNVYNGAERLATAAGVDVSRWTADDARTYALQLPYLSGEQRDALTNADEATLRSTGGPLNANATDGELAARGLERTDFNMRVGQSALRGGKFFMNMEIPVGDNAELYAFGGLSNRDGEAAGFYRFPNQERTYSPAYPNGFLPEIHTTIGDQSMAVGIRGDLKGWSADFSNTFGRNAIQYNVRNSLNATLQNSTPFEFDAGGLSFSQNTTNFDLSRYWGNVLSGLNVAMGSEFRVENFQIDAGAQNSYASYDIFGQVVTPTTPSANLARDFFGRSRPGGAQVFPGFRPDNELSEFRNSVAAYADVEADLSESFLLTGAVRFENYSDFGSTTNFKTSARYKLGDNWAVRGAASTGFRAPSLHQIYFNSTSTLFVDGIPFEVGTFSNNSRIARILGIPQLKQEESTNLSFGLTGRIPSANLSLTVDAFQVDIQDRVVLTGTFASTSGQTPEQQAELAYLFGLANATRATFFVNSIDTRTQGVDIVLTHDLRLNNGKLTTSLAGVFSKTEQVGDIKTSDALKGLEGIYFDETSRIFLEEAVPRTKVNLSFNLSMGKFNAFLRNVYFGAVTEATNTIENQQVFSEKIVTDLTLGYDLSKQLNITIGANNLLDVYPDEAIPANQGSGQFLYSRRSQQFGFMGRFAFARVRFTL